MKVVLSTCLLLGTAVEVWTQNHSGYSAIRNLPSKRHPQRQLKRASPVITDSDLVNSYTGSNISKRNVAGTLTLNETDGIYYSTVQIGSNNKAFTVWIESGVTEFWVTGSNCTTGGCSGARETLGIADSTTLLVTNRSWSTSDEVNADQVSGVLVHDSVTLAGARIPWMQFGVASQIEISSDGVDGGMGLAPSQGGNLRPMALTVIQQMFRNKLLLDPLVGIYLEPTGNQNPGAGEMTLGTVNNASYTGSPVEVPNISTQGLWEAAVDDVKVGGQALGFQGKTVLIDSTNAWFWMTSADATSVHRALTNNNFTTDTDGGFYFSCSVNTELDFVFSGVSFSISPQDYILWPVTTYPNGSATPSNWCASNIQGIDGLDPPWSFGGAFIRNVFTVFDYGVNQMLFAVPNSS